MRKMTNEFAEMAQLRWYVHCRIYSLDHTGTNLNYRRRKCFTE